ncbi:MAG: hypothetical protein SWN10_21880 [Pseudomonadota bacterium]|nr:hypothetical protein [Pseudomonadota bacterium]
MKQCLYVSVFILVLTGCTEAPQTQSSETPAAADSQQLTESEKLNQWFDVKYEEQLGV